MENFSSDNSDSGAWTKPTSAEMEKILASTSGGIAWTKSTIDHQQDNWHFSSSNNSNFSQSEQLWRNPQPQIGSINEQSTTVVGGVVNKTEVEEALSNSTDTSGIWQGLNMGAKDWDINVHSALQGVGQWGSVGASSSLWGVSEPLTQSLDINVGKSVHRGSVESSGESSTNDAGNISQSALFSGPQHKETDSDSQWNNPSTDDVSTVSPLLPPTKEELLLRIKDEEFSNLLNNNAGWGQRRIDQSTPWEVGETRDNRKIIDTMVWNHEPNNGTGIWETFYEQQGALPAHWRIQNSRDASDNRASNSEWIDGQWNSSGGGHGWKDGLDVGQFNCTGAVGKPRGSSSSWGDDCRSVAGNWVANDSDWTNQPSTPVTPLTPGGGPSSGSQWCDRQDDSASCSWKAGGWDGGSSGGRPNSWADKKDWTNDPLRRAAGNVGRTNRPPEMRSQALKSLMDLGFTKQDAQNALIMHNMDIESALQDLINGRTGERTNNVGSVSDNGTQNVDISSLSSDSRFHNAHGIAPTFPTVPGVPGGGSQSAAVPPMRPNLNHQQQVMRQQIIQQLRFAVQNRILSPNMLISSGNNMTSKDLRLIQQLVQAQTNLTKLTNQRTQMVRQMQMSNPQNQMGIQTLQAQLQYLNPIIERTQAQISMLSKNIQSQQESPAATSASHEREEASFLTDSMSVLKVSEASQSGVNGPRLETSRIANWKMTSTDEANSKMQSNMHNNQTGAAQAAALQAAAMAYNRSLSQHGDTTHSVPQSTWSEDLGSRNGAVAPMDSIPEFVPGQPWQGGFKDDPSLTPAAMSTMLGVRSEHLAGLANSDVVQNGLTAATSYGALRNVNRGISPGGHNMPPNIGGRPWMGDQSAFAKVNNAAIANSQSQNWLLIRNLQPNISPDVLKMVCAQQGQVLGMQSHPAGFWTLVRFGLREEAAKALRQLSSIPCGGISVCNDQEAVRLIQEIAHGLSPSQQRWTGNNAWDPMMTGGGQPHGSFDEANH